MPPTPSLFDSITLTEFARHLREQAVDPGRVPSYRKLYEAVQDGLIQADFIGRDRWVRKTDVPAIAKLFGVTLRNRSSAA
jgi:hypothetical protein